MSQAPSNTSGAMSSAPPGVHDARPPDQGQSSGRQGDTQAHTTSCTTAPSKTPSSRTPSKPLTARTHGNKVRISPRKYSPSKMPICGVIDPALEALMPGLEALLPEVKAEGAVAATTEELQQIEALLRATAQTGSPAPETPDFLAAYASTTPGAALNSAFSSSVSLAASLGRSTTPGTGSDNGSSSGHGPAPVMGTNGSQSSARQKTSFKRTKTGCVNCKFRKVKCDEVQPTCSSCARLGIECSGWDATLSKAEYSARKAEFLKLVAARATNANYGKDASSTNSMAGGLASSGSAAARKGRRASMDDSTSMLKREPSDLQRAPMTSPANSAQAGRTKRRRVLMGNPASSPPRNAADHAALMRSSPPTFADMLPTTGGAMPKSASFTAGMPLMPPTFASVQAQLQSMVATSSSNAALHARQAKALSSTNKSTGSRVPISTQTNPSAHPPLQSQQQLQHQLPTQSRTSEDQHDPLQPTNLQHQKKKRGRPVGSMNKNSTKVRAQQEAARTATGYAAALPQKPAYQLPSLSNVSHPPSSTTLTSTKANGTGNKAGQPPAAAAAAKAAAVNVPTAASTPARRPGPGRPKGSTNGSGIAAAKARAKALAVEQAQALARARLDAARAKSTSLSAAPAPASTTAASTQGAAPVLGKFDIPPPSTHTPALQHQANNHQHQQHQQQQQQQQQQPTNGTSKTSLSVMDHARILANALFKAHGELSRSGMFDGYGERAGGGAGGGARDPLVVENQDVVGTSTSRSEHEARK
ncbi:hypothetical protein PYCC9005_000699 [Savitreella phatthalungensis]